MPKISTPAVSIQYADDGHGAPVVLVHGWPDSARGWDPVRAGLLADGYRVIVPDLRGCGQTSFVSEDIVRDGSAAALAQDVLDLADALDLDRFAVVGHDWGARTAYVLAAVAPERLTSITALALGYQPGGQFSMPPFGQARRFWYQWLLYVDAGVAAFTADPVGFARIQWETWSPPGWFDDAEFLETAHAFHNPDWAAITANAYRSRFLASEPRDIRYDEIRRRITAAQRIAVPTLMLQGGADECDPPEMSEGHQSYFESYVRTVIADVGHFPHREAPGTVLSELRRHVASGEGRRH